MNIVNHLLHQIEPRVLKDGGVLSHTGGECRSDSTAWTIIACHKHINLIHSLKKLAALQSADGRVPLIPECPEAWWPTALAILAWSTTPLFEKHSNKAKHFLLSHGGKTMKKEEKPIIGDNTELQGWGWVEGTYSWVEPTCMSMLALEAAGIKKHPRIEEGRRLLIDRMLPGGGWNFGNKSVFGKSFSSIVEYTGMALCILKDQINTAKRTRALRYLQDEYQNVRTPLALSWAVIGLSANSMRPGNVQEKIMNCIELQNLMGEYDTTSLSMLLLALHDDPFEWRHNQ